MLYGHRSVERYDDAAGGVWGALRQHEWHRVVYRARVGGEWRASTLLVQSSGDILLNNGDGSAGWFANTGGGTYLTEMDRDFSILTSTGSGSSTIYTRTYPDS